MTEVLRAAHVCLHVDDGGVSRAVLDDVSLELVRGEFVALRGPSGSGKTSLLAVLGGLLTPTRGDVFLDGMSIVRLRDHHRTALRRTTIGFVVQELALIGGVSVLDNVLLPFVPDGVSERDRDEARRWLGRFGIGDRAASRAASLSGGERQRVALARALVRGPSVLLLDEPTAHVDATTAASLLDELCALRDEGRTLLVATHDPRVLADPRIDRIIDLDRGRLSATPEPRQSP